MIRMDKNILHNAEELWMKYEADSMTDAERIAFLEQALDDEEGLEQLVFLENNRVPMPAYLEEEILGHILGEELLEERGHAETVSVSSGRSSWAKIDKHLELLCYSAKITFATAFAIAALFLLPDCSELYRAGESKVMERELEAKERAREKRENARSNTSYVADVFQYLSKIIYDGGFNND